MRLPDMLTLSLVLLTFACGGRKAESVDAPATPDGAPTVPIEGQPGPTINPTESQAAVHKALSVRDPEPECAAVSALTPEPVADLIFVANHADQPPWASTRAARCLALGHGEAAKAELLGWMGDPSAKGLALMLLAELDQLPEPLAMELAQAALAGPLADEARPRIAKVENANVRALAL